MKRETVEELKGLLHNLKDADWWVRKEAVGKLLNYDEALYLSALEEWLRNGEDALLRNASMETYKGLGRRAIGSLVRMLEDEDSDVRIFSANVLGDIKDQEALGPLVMALQDPDDNVRIAAAEALGKIGDTRAVGPLTMLLGDTPWTAMAVVEALGKIGGRDALAALYKCLDNEDYQRMACAVLARAGDGNSIEHLASLLRSEEANELVVQAIVDIAEREKIVLPPLLFSGNIDLLIQWLGSPQEEIRKTAFIALSWSEDMRCLPHFIKAFQDDLLLEYALKGLLSLGRNAAPEIVEAMKKPGKHNGTLAKVLAMTGAEESLMLFAGDEDEEVRTEVALAIGRLKTPEATVALQALSRDRAEEVREAALLSLRNSER